MDLTTLVLINGRGVSKAQALARIFNQVQTGKIFSVRFTKRGDGQEREMRCRFGVKSHLKGGELGYDAFEKALFTVFDMDKRGYRSIPWEGISEVKVEGQRYLVERIPE